MKQRFSSHMTLIELTLALFFLMLAMVTVLGLFTTAYNMSADAQDLTYAVQLAQDCAALIEGSVDPLAALLDMGYEQKEPDTLLHETGDYLVFAQIKGEQTEVGVLYEATVCVEREGKNLVSLPAVRYNKEVISQ